MQEIQRNMQLSTQGQEIPMRDKDFVFNQIVENAGA